MVYATKLEQFDKEGHPITTAIYIGSIPSNLALIEKIHYDASPYVNPFFDHSAKNRYDILSKLKDVKISNVSLSKETMDWVESHRKVIPPKELEDLLEAK